MKYRSKPTVIEAVQWFPGVAVPGAKGINGFARCPDYAAFTEAEKEILKGMVEE